MNEEAVNAILNTLAAETEQDIRLVPGHDDLGYTIAHGGHPVIIDLGKHAARPTAKRGTFTLTEPASFADYVTRHHGDGTAVFTRPREGVATAILDGHGTDPGHGSHTAEMRLSKTATWRRVTAGCAAQSISQEAFANWLDDIRDEVRGPLAPDDLIELIDNLHVHASSNQSEVRATGHGRQIAYQENVAIKAGKAGVELPNKLLLESTVFDGVDKAWRFEVRLTVIAGPGRPTQFRLSIPRLDDVVEAAMAEAMAIVADGLDAGIPVYVGSAQHHELDRPTTFTA